MYARIAGLALILLMAPLVASLPDLESADSDSVDWLNSPGASTDPITPSDDDLRDYISVAEEMHARWSSLDDACDPDAVFGLLYLVTTAKVGDLVAADHFADNPYLVEWDRDFADRYFQAYDAYHAGEDTPDPWRIAFEHADSGTSTVSEDILLGMNAHVNYDLAFSTYAMGLPQKGAKEDYDRVNDAFWNVVKPVGYEMGARYDPEQTPNSEEMGPDDQATVELLISWREAAWANAVLLADAPDDASRDLVAQSIEAEAATIAQGIAQNQEDTTQERLSHCQSADHEQLSADLGGPGYGDEWFEDDHKVEKFLICHTTGSGEKKTMYANEHSWHAHEAHGDTKGKC